MANIRSHLLKNKSSAVTV